MEETHELEDAEQDELEDDDKRNEWVWNWSKYITEKTIVFIH